MKMFVETAAAYEQDWAAERGLLDGTWLSLASLSAARRPTFEVLEELAAEGAAPVCIELAPDERQPMLDLARRMQTFSPLAVPVLPPTEPGFLVGRRLAQDGAVVAFHCCSPAQAFLAAKAGAKLVAVPAAAVAAGGANPLELAVEVESLLVVNDFTCELLLTELATPAAVVEAALRGLPGAAATLQVLREVGAHHLTSLLIERAASMARLVPEE